MGGMAGAIAAAALLLAAGTAARGPSLPRASAGRAALSDIPGPERAMRRRSSSRRLLYHGGPVLHASHTHVIFWQPSGSGLKFDPGYLPLVERFLGDVGADSHRTSNVFGLTGQYTDYTGKHAAYASRYGGAVLDTDRLPANGCVEPPVTGPGWTVCLTDRQLQDELEHVVRVHRLPAGPTDVYFLVTPRGFGSCFGAAPTSGCALGGSRGGYCGYHGVTNDGLLLYAVIPFNAVAGHCQSGNPRPNHNSADPALSALSHELSEMITDPRQTAWYTSGGSENGDICASAFGPALGGSRSSRYNELIHGGRYYLQEEWSNASGACEQRAPADRVSFSVTRREGRKVWLRAVARDPEGRIVAYHWSFGDGHTGRGRTVSHRYARTGSRKVTLRVTDSWRNWGFYTVTVRV